MPRSFRVPEGRTLTLPNSVQAGPGATNMRLHPGSVITLDDDVCTQNQRFLNNRVSQGDLEEVTAEVAAELAKEATPPELLPKPDPTKPMATPGLHAKPGKER